MCRKGLLFDETFNFPDTFPYFPRGSAACSPTKQFSLVLSCTFVSLFVVQGGWVGGSASLSLMSKMGALLTDCVYEIPVSRDLHKLQSRSLIGCVFEYSTIGCSWHFLQFNWLLQIMRWHLALRFCILPGQSNSMPISLASELSRSHCDPRMWSTVRTARSRRLSDPVLIQLYSITIFCSGFTWYFHALCFVVQSSFTISYGVLSYSALWPEQCHQI